MVPAEGFEPPTFGLQNRCTTTVLSRHAKKGWMRKLLAFVHARKRFVCEAGYRRFSYKTLEKEYGLVHAGGNHCCKRTHHA
jgi:hypothetical protein